MPDYGNIGSFLTPVASEFAGYDLPLSQRFKYNVDAAAREGITSLLIDWANTQHTRYYPTTPTRSSTIQELQERYRGTAFANTDWRKFTNSDGTVNADTENYLYNRFKERETTEALTRGSYNSLSSGAVSFAGAIAGSLLDPLTLATAFIPMTTARTVAGATLARFAPRAGQGLLAHAAVGAAENALITGTLIEPVAGVLHNRMDDPYTMKDYWNNVGMASLIGAGFGAVGGVFDFSGRRLVNEYLQGKAPEIEVNRPTKFKQDEIPENTRRMSNVDPETIDLAIKAHIDAEQKGNTAFSADKLFELSQDMNRSTITPASRELATLATRIADGGEGKTRVRLGEATKRGKGENRHWVAKFEVEGKIVEGTGSTKKQAELDLNRKVYSEIQKYQPTYTKQGDMYVARYTEDQGKASMLTGAGRTKTEALRNLNERYRDITRSVAELDQTMRDINMLREDIRSGRLSEYATEWQNNLAERARNLHSDFEQGIIREREYIKGLKDLDKELKDFETDYNIAEENMRNYLKDVYDRRIPESPEKMMQEGIDALNHTTEGSRVRTEEYNAKVAEATETNTSAEAHARRTQRQEDEVFTSDAYESLTPELKETLTNEYATAKADADILNSKQVDDIISKYISCRKGM